jgi:hypothetical protein
MKRGAWLVIAALAIASGCGGGDQDRLSKGAYEAKLHSAFADANTQLGPGPHAAGSIDLLSRIAKGYGGIAAALKGVRPPAKVQALNDSLVAAAADRAAALKALVTKLRPAPPPKRQQLLAEYDASQIGRDDFDSAVAGLEVKGYRFRPSAGT